MSSLMLRLNSSFATYFGRDFERVMRFMLGVCDDNMKLGVLRRNGEFGRLSSSPDLISTTRPNIFPTFMFCPGPITSQRKRPLDCC